MIVLILNFIIQIGFLINNDYCWYTRFINKIIDPEKLDVKWRSCFPEFITHYIRGNSWAYSDIRTNDFRLAVLLSQISFIYIFSKRIIN